MNSCWSLGPGVLVSLDKLGISEQERRKKIGEIWEKRGEKHGGHWSVSAYNQYPNKCNEKYKNLRYKSEYTRNKKGEIINYSSNVLDR